MAEVIYVKQREAEDSNNWEMTLGKNGMNRMNGISKSLLKGQTFQVS